MDSEPLTKLIQNLHSEINDANCVVRETGSYFVTFSVPADLENATAAAIRPDQPPFLHGPKVQALIERAAGEELTVRAKGDGIYRLPAHAVGFMVGIMA